MDNPNNAPNAPNLRKRFGKKTAKTASKKPAHLYIGKDVPLSKVEEYAKLANLDLAEYSKESTASGYNGTAIFLDLMGNYLQSLGVPEATVQEFINSLQ